ncbi:hypothetical protein [Georgenia sp. MJ170]|uniref:hypothetical protein n=1 Tax=Georgenia sunbinii TaxID=3117728 RepID=UPI002F2628E2
MTDVLAALVNGVALVLVAIVGNRKLKRIEADTKASREQVENDHLADEYPNLRDELTATRGLIHGIGRKLDRAVSWLQDLTEADRHHEQALDRKAEAADRALAVAVRERERELSLLRRELPEMIQRELDGRE